MKTKLPLGVVNAVPASQIVAGTVSGERALSLPEGSMTQEQKDSLMRDPQKKWCTLPDKITILSVIAPD